MGAGIFVTIVLLFPLMVDRSAGWHNAANMDWCNIDFIKKNVAPIQVIWIAMNKQMAGRSKLATEEYDYNKFL
jgi:hypothetical protein